MSLTGRLITNHRLLNHSVTDDGLYLGLKAGLPGEWKGSFWQVKGPTGAGTAPGWRNWLFPLSSASGGRAASCMAWTLLRWCALLQCPSRSCSSRSRVRHFKTGHWYRTTELSWMYRQWTSSCAWQPVNTHPGTGHCTLARLESPPASSALVVVPSICNQLKNSHVHNFVKVLRCLKYL